ncbi:cupin domain-containing protein [Pontibacter sp. SGAir0037]|uniref:cupin domain-containing protein n=1 Tax=Pontibacter sp. SGAir0037 TaxID=2571030 RepID=UPI0010CD3A46|nr:cupin domain-containing protein [Pontibacter sp. SGAir0037]QCR21045.1 cupin [Pontibacter sp. SGAir0037]
MENKHIIPLFLRSGKHIPNNPDLPLMLYKQVFTDQKNLENKFKASFAEHNWRGTWTNGVFDYHHYHSTAHEVLGVAAGSATIQFGGPEGEKLEVKAGDMVILPAGTGHCRIKASRHFTVVGAYPAGQEKYDICTEEDDAEAKKRQIAQVPLPATDPIEGANGPLLQYWQAKNSRSSFILG